MKRDAVKHQHTPLSFNVILSHIKLLAFAIAALCITISALVTHCFFRYFEQQGTELPLPTQATLAIPQPVTDNALPQPPLASTQPPFKTVQQSPNKVPFKLKPQQSWQTVHIKRGDTLSTIFADLGLDQETLANVKKLKKNAWGRLHPGQKIAFNIDQDNELQGLEVKLSQRENLIIKRVGKRYQAFLEQIVPTRNFKHFKLRIHRSLYKTAHRSGISDKIVLQLINIFNWDVDFTRELHHGDELEILYETFQIDNEAAGVGNLLYTKIKTRRKSYEAVRYTDPKGRSTYYTPDGKSLRKAFLRMPVKYGHISSYFNLSRMHPVLHKIRAHKGVDYAAPRGTPVKSAGDGMIVFTGYKGGYGNTIVVKHSDTYETLYAHLDRVAKQVRPGKAVAQGDIIGYVGSTGLATGPHLHYEFHIKGQHHDPLGAKLPHSLPITKTYRADFQKSTKKILNALKQSKIQE